METADRWKEMYNEEYFPLSHEASDSSALPSWLRIRVLDCVEDLKWFCHLQTFRLTYHPPTQTDEEFVEQATEQYARFLALAQRYPKMNTVALEPVDLVWHAHQMHPQNYYQDMEFFCGQVLEHDPWPLITTSWKPEPLVAQAYYKTGDEYDQRWKKEFGVGYLQSFSYLEWRCDGCSSSIDPDAPRFHCAEDCDVDYCADCVQNGRAQHEHELVQKSYLGHQQLDFNCDSCGSMIPSDKERYHCAKEKCDFDLCGPCYAANSSAHSECGLREANHPSGSLRAP